MKRIAAILVLLSSLSNAREPNPRATRATGVTLTVLGALNLALVGAFGGIYAAGACTPECTSGNDHSTLYTGAGIGGMAGSAVVGTALLSVGIPLIVRARF
jgi:hypothetical protein